MVFGTELDNKVFIDKVTRDRDNFTQSEIIEFCRSYRAIDQNTLYSLKMAVKANVATKKRRACNFFRFTTPNYSVEITPTYYVGKRNDNCLKHELAVKLHFTSYKTKAHFNDAIVNYNAMNCDDIIKHIYETLINLEHLDNAFNGTHDIECEIRERRDSQDNLIPNQICLNFNFNFGQNLVLQGGFEKALHKRINLAKYCDGTSTDCGDIIAFYSTQPTKRELAKIKKRAIEGAVKYISSLNKQCKKDIRWF